jgi:hypothetical protein
VQNGESFDLVPDFITYFSPVFSVHIVLNDFRRYLKGFEFENMKCRFLGITGILRLISFIMRSYSDSISQKAAENSSDLPPGNESI